MTIFSNKAILALTQRPSRFMFHKSGWRVVGEVPKGNLVAVVYPHTSNWDFPIGLAAVFMLQLDARWVGKHTLFRWPFGSLMRWLGGIPVNRSSPEGIIEQVADVFRQSENLLIAVTPEGTRSRVDKWKTGFHRIAKAADVPIWVAAFDYPSKQIVLGPTFRPTDDLDADLEKIYDFFRDKHGKRPENEGGIPEKVT